MKYAIVYSSQTGNTALLANHIQEQLGNHVSYIGKPEKEALDADIVCIGFWTDKGTCPDEIKDFIKNVHNKQVFLFGTAGFGGKQEYFDHILDSVLQHLPQDNTLLSTYMCQGKMPLPLRKRYEAMLSKDEHMKLMIENFDKALTHPDENDLLSLKNKIDEAILLHR